MSEPLEVLFAVFTEEISERYLLDPGMETSAQVTNDRQNMLRKCPFRILAALHE
jgi:hypothetical protein